MNVEKKFIKLCKEGNLKELKKLYSKNPNINVSIEDDCELGTDISFRNACKYGHLNVVKWLLKIKRRLIEFYLI